MPKYLDIQNIETIFFYRQAIKKELNESILLFKQIDASLCCYLCIYKERKVRKKKVKAFLSSNQNCSCQGGHLKTKESH